MRVNIGNQSGVYICASALLSSALFTLPSSFAYLEGNSTYIWVPLSILLCSGLFAAAAVCMERTGCSSLDDFLVRAFGNLLGKVTCVLFALLLLYCAYSLLGDFAAILRTYIFVDVEFTGILLWLAAVLFVLTLGGIGRIQLTAAFFGGLLLIVLLLALVLPIKSYETYRLYPLFSENTATIARLFLHNTLRAAPAPIALLCVSQHMRGRMRITRTLMICGGICVPLACLAQLSVALSYPNSMLQELLAPLCSISLGAASYGTFLRTSELKTLVWLIGGLIACAFYLYAAATLCARITRTRDVRPVSAAFVTLTLATVYAGQGHLYDAAHRLFVAMERYTFLFVLPVITLASLLTLIKATRGPKV